MQSHGNEMQLTKPLLQESTRALVLSFWMEWVAVWAFAAAWLTKGRAMVAEIAVDLMAIPGQLLRKREQDISN